MQNPPLLPCQTEPFRPIYHRIKAAMKGVIFLQRNNLSSSRFCPVLPDSGPAPAVIPLSAAAKKNLTFRSAVWTGKHLQLTLMSIPVGECVGLEQHSHLDQMLVIERGHALVRMGFSRNSLTVRQSVSAGCAVLVPAGTWHNIINAGKQALKLYSVYAPPQHPHGTVHKTKSDSENSEQDS